MREQKGAIRASKTLYNFRNLLNMAFLIRSIYDNQKTLRRNNFICRSLIGKAFIRISLYHYLLQAISATYKSDLKINFSRESFPGSFICITDLRIPNSPSQLRKRVEHLSALASFTTEFKRRPKFCEISIQQST